MPFLYGEPTREGEAAARRGEVELGGCCIWEKSPKWHCRACKHDFGKLEGCR